MAAERNEILRTLSSETSSKLPAFIEKLSDEDIEDLQLLIQRKIETKTAGLDNLYKVIAEGLRYLPNFLIHALIKLVDPPILASIAAKIEWRELHHIARDVPLEYMQMTFLYLDKKTGGKLLSALNQRKMKQVFDYVYNKNHRKILDFAEELPLSDLRIFLEGIDVSVYEDETIKELYRVAYNKVKEATRY